MPTTRALAISTGAILAAAMLACPVYAEITDVRINEAYANQVGSPDTAECIELYGPPGTDLTGLTVVFIDGDTFSEGVIDQVVTVSGTIPADGLWVIGQTTTPNPGAGNPPDQLLSNSIENGTQTYLLVTGFTGAVNDDIDTDNNGVADAGYTAIGTIVDSVAVNDNGVGSGDRVYYDAPLIGPASDGFGPAGVARAADGVDTDTLLDWCITSFYQVPPATGTGSDGYQAASPGVPNSYDCQGPANNPPVAFDNTANVAQNASPGQIITLVASDSDEDPLTYIIVTLPASGTLTDPDNGDAAVSAGGSLTANHVRYSPATDVTGDFSFTFKVNDTHVDSNTATVTVHVLATPTQGIIITEIMYDPGSQPDGDYEYVELYNPSGSPVDLTGYVFDDSADPVLVTANITGGTIPALGTAVLVPAGQLSAAQAAWGTGINFIATTNALSLNNSGGDHIGVWNNITNYNGRSYATALDELTYSDGSPWPGSDGSKSIYLTDVGLNNGLPTSWARSAVGVAGAYQSNPAGTNNSSNTGSPGVVPWSTPATPPAVVSVISRRAHGAAGDFDINPGDTAGIECRMNGPTLIIVTFDKSIQQVNGTNADVSLSSGNVSSLSLSGAELQIAMTGTTPATPLTVSFPGIATAGSPSAVATGTVCIRLLAGDPNSDASVNIFDLIAIRNQLNQPVAAGNFRMDINADGLINIFDLIATRNVLNQSVAACGS